MGRPGDGGSTSIPQVEYDVISAAIAHVLAAEPFAGAPETEDRAPYDLVVIASQPNAEVRTTIASIQADDGTFADASTLRSLAQRPDTGTFEARFSGIGRYEVVDAADVQRLLAEGSWPAFHRRYPGAPGLFVSSRVGIRADGGEAAVIVMHIRGGTWGHTDAMLFRKRDGAWTFAGMRRIAEF